MCSSGSLRPYFPFPLYYTLYTTFLSCRASQGAVLSQPARRVRTQLRQTRLQGSLRKAAGRALQEAGAAIPQQQQQQQQFHPAAARAARTVLTHCCGQQDSKARRSFSHLAASSPWLSRHCQNSSRAPQHAFLSSIVGAAIAAAALNAAHGRCPSAARGAPARESPALPRCLTRPSAREGRAPEAIPALSRGAAEPRRVPPSFPPLLPPSPPPVPPRGAGTELPRPPVGSPRPVLL